MGWEDDEQDHGLEVVDVPIRLDTSGLDTALRGAARRAAAVATALRVRQALAHLPEECRAPALAAIQTTLARTGRARAQCPGCGTFTLNGQHPVEHRSTCKEAGNDHD